MAYISAAEREFTFANKSDPVYENTLYFISRQSALAHRNCTQHLHEISDQILSDVLKARLFPLVDAYRLVLPPLAGAQTAGAVVDLAVCRREQRLVDPRLGRNSVVTTSTRASRHGTDPVRRVLALDRDCRRAPLHILNRNRK